MSLNDLKNAKKKVVGAKQTLKAIKNGNALKVYVALDAEPRVIDPILRACQERGVEVIKVEHMVDLGHACTIKVSAAVAAILEV